MISPWNARDVYGCLNPSCRSRVLILRSSLNQVPRPRVPRCMCGGFLTPDASAGGDAEEDAPVPEMPGPSDADPSGSFP